MREWLYDVFRERPWWMSAAMVFSAYMAFVYVPWDLFLKPVAEDEEVWFGIVFHGVWAKVLAIPHWFVYAAAVYGFRRRRPWMAFWAPAYVAQVAFGMFLWTALEQGGFTGVVLGLIPAAPFVALTIAFWNARDHFAPKSLQLVERYGGWALVTGASSGIGAAIARKIAAEGMDLVLTARREERLASLAGELERDFGIRTRVVVADLTRREDQVALVSAVVDLEIGLLVNNAGLGQVGRFDLLEVERLRDLVAVHCEAPLFLSHAFVQGMRERGRGAILLTGSIAGHLPVPLHAVHSATKAFELFLGEALWAELRASNIDVAVLEPGPTESEFQERAGEIPHPGQRPEEVARRGLEALGRQPSVIVGWGDWIRTNVASRFLTRPIAVQAAYAAMAKRTPEDLR